MERRFTIRLDAQDSASIEKLKEISREVTDSGAIRFAVNNYTGKYNELKETKRELIKVRIELDELKEDIRTFFELTRKLKGKRND